MNLLTVTVSNW
jgi:hypothetical protein